MAPVNIPPIDEARAVFRRLGYDVSGDGATLEARRKWRTVSVHVCSADDLPETREATAMADGGRERPGYRCFVTWRDGAAALRDRLESRSLGDEWAVIGVDRAGDHEVVRAPDAGR
jgi:hypothetical protein